MFTSDHRLKAAVSFLAAYRLMVSNRASRGKGNEFAVAGLKFREGDSRDHANCYPFDAVFKKEKCGKTCSIEPAAIWNCLLKVKFDLARMGIGTI